MGDVVASGGYYMAVAADALLAEDATVTGSIGVVGGKANLTGLFRSLGLGKDAVERGARAGMLSLNRGFTEDERSALQEEMASIYAGFTDRVAEGRGLSPSQISAMSQAPTAGLHASEDAFSVQALVQQPPPSHCSSASMMPLPQPIGGPGK